MTERPDDAAAGPQCEKCGKGMRDTGFLRSVSLPLYQCDVCHATRAVAKPAPTPSDDDEPITREWFESEFGPGDYWLTRSIKLSLTPSGLLTIATNCDCCSGDVHRWLEGTKTRGQLRALLAAMGWKAKG